jgi:hypothetical protein
MPRGTAITTRAGELDSEFSLRPERDHLSEIPRHGQFTRQPEQLASEVLNPALLAAGAEPSERGALAEREQTRASMVPIGRLG